MLRHVVMLVSVAMAGRAASATSIRMAFRRPFTEKFSGRGSFEKMFTCRRCQRVPKVDGRLDDDAWKVGGEIEFGDGKPRTTVRVCYDDATLYLAFVCYELPGRKALGTPRDRDSEVWKDDAVEICLGPPQVRKTRIWYHIILSVANCVYDQRTRFGKRFGDEWSPSFEHATQRYDDRWTAEVAVPASALDMPGWPSVLGADVGRDGPGLGPSFWGKRRDVESSAFVFQGVGDTASEEDGDDGFVSNQTVMGKSLGVYVDRTYARPGERWIEIDFRVTPTKVALEATRIDVKLYPFAQTTPVETFSTVPEQARGRLDVDLRKHGLEAAEVSVEVFEGEDLTGVSKFILAARPCAAPLEPGDRIEMVVDVPEGVQALTREPVTLGVPFPAGALWDADRVHVVDGAGKPVPQQKEATGRWAPDGSIKWMRFDALVTPDGGCFVQFGEPSGSAAPPTPLKVVEEDGKVVVDTGVVRYVLAKGTSPIEEVWLDGTRVASSAGVRGLYVVDQKGRLAQAVAEEEDLRIEARGPVASCVRFEGWYATADGERLARHMTRVECFAGQAAAKVTHTFVLTQDTNEVWFRDVGWELAVAPGDGARALFGIDWQKHEKQLAVPLGGDAASAYMLQDSHYYFNHSQNHFAVVAGTGETKIEGEECGDYAALVGKKAGLELICRNAAHQHPKEFEVFADRNVLKLFSNRAGEELDFRTETLVKKWDLATWYEHRTSNNMYANYYRKHVLEALNGYKSNAAGWAKTHLLLIAPLEPAGAEASAARHARLHRTPVYVHADPSWIYRTRAMGPNYPRDPERFPEIEETVEGYFRWLANAQKRWGEYGFIDYNGGPRFSYYERKGKLWPEMKRFNMTYALRANLWLLYARSANREIREFIAGSGRGHMDGKMANWDTRVSRRGLIRSSAHRDLPFDWGEANMMQNGQTGCLNILIWHYYLTGYRRAKDMIEDYAAASKRRWSPSVLMHPTYPAFTLLRLAQAYAFTWDRDLRDLCSVSMDMLEDKQSRLGVNKYAYSREEPRGKAMDVSRAYFEGWDLIGETRYYNVARKIGDYLFHTSLLKTVDGYVPTMGRVAAFLYDDRPDQILAENMHTQALRLPPLYNPETKEIVNCPFYCSAATNFLGRIGNALHVVTQANADREPCTSWIAFDDAGSETTVCVQKPQDSELRLYYTSPGPPSELKGIKPKSPYAQSFYQVRLDQGRGIIHLPKDIAGYAYGFSLGSAGLKVVFADRRVPMVLHASGYWYPEPVHRPASKYYFRVPPDSQDAQIFFEGDTQLYDPLGEPFGETTKGWIDLPSDRPGLWAFEPIVHKLVRARNFPPFFAVRDSANHFVPGIPWAREPKAEPAEEIPPGTTFLPGAIATEGNQALYLGKRGFTIPAGEPRADGEGSELIPFTEGTIEFFMKPVAWSSFELPAPHRKLIFIAHMDGGGYFCADYTIRGRGKSLNAFLHSRYRNTERDQGEMMIRAYRPRTLFERGRWVHLAYVWGHRKDVRYHPRRLRFGEKVLTVRVYVDGKYLSSGGNRDSGKNSFMKGPLMRVLFAGSGIAMDELRVSDTQRYKEDFKPPSRDEELNADEHTRVLYHFNGDREGVSKGGE